MILESYKLHREYFNIINIVNRINLINESDKL